MTIEPDTKNWTWVLDEACPDCGLDTSRVRFRSIPGLIEANVAAWPAALDVEDPRRRPDASTWSPLEYAAHVRDVFDRFTARVELMLTQDDPAFENWDQDATAIAENYNDQDPSTVVRQLQDAGEAVATAFREVPDDALGRTGRRSDGSAFTVETLARYFIHDPVHHLYDVTGTRFVH